MTVKIAEVSETQIIRLITIFSLWLVVALIPAEILFDETRVLCIHRYLFGFQCPLCGMTRAVYEFTHFRFVSALNYNVVVVLLPVWLGIEITTVFFRQNWMSLIKKIVFILIIAGLLLLYAFRIINHFNVFIIK